MRLLRGTSSRRWMGVVRAIGPEERKTRLSASSVRGAGAFVDQGGCGRRGARERLHHRSAARSDLQLVPVVIDDQHIKGAEQVHPQGQSRLVRELPVLEEIHIAKEDPHTLNLQAAKIEVGQWQVVSALNVKRDSDDFFLPGVARRMAQQGFAKRQVADGTLGAGVDDRLRAY